MWRVPPDTGALSFHICTTRRRSRTRLTRTEVHPRQCSCSNNLGCLVFFEPSGAFRYKHEIQLDKLVELGEQKVNWPNLIINQKYEFSMYLHHKKQSVAYNLQKVYPLPKNFRIWTVQMIYVFQSPKTQKIRWILDLLSVNFGAQKVMLW